jgi:hypothetical protein
MIPYRASVGLLVLAVLAGCGKRSRDGGDTRGGPNILGVAIPGGNPTTRPSATKVIEVLDGMTVMIGQDKHSLFSLRKVAGELPANKLAPNAAGVGLDGSAERDRIDAAFAKFWDALEKLPEARRQARVRQRAEVLTKQGVAPDKARAEAEKTNPAPPTYRLTTPTDPDFGILSPGLIQAQVADGVRANWSLNGSMRVVGEVRFRESLRVHPNGDLTVRLKGQAGKLELSANGDVTADLVDLRAPVVEVSPNGGLLLRVGPETTIVRIQGGVHGGLILARGNPQLRVEGSSDPTRQVAVVGY